MVQERRLPLHLHLHKLLRRTPRGRRMSRDKAIRQGSSCSSNSWSRSTVGIGRRRMVPRWAMEVHWVHRIRHRLRGRRLEDVHRSRRGGEEAYRIHLWRHPLLPVESILPLLIQQPHRSNRKLNLEHNNQMDNREYTSSQVLVQMAHAGPSVLSKTYIHMPTAHPAILSNHLNSHLTWVAFQCLSHQASPSHNSNLAPSSQAYRFPWAISGLNT